MRVSVAVAMATLTLGWASRPMLAQVPSGVPALESIHMIDSLIGWAVTYESNRLSGEAANALVRTVDGGSKWKDVTPPLGGAQRSFFYLNATNVNVLTSHFAWLGPFRTHDGGRTWRVIRTPGFVRSIYFINARDGWLLSYQGANSASVETGVYRSVDGGESWTKVASSRNGMEKSDLPDVVGGDPHITFLDAVSGWIMRSDPVTLPEWSYLYVTHNGARNWAQQKLPLPPQLKSAWVGIKPPKFFSSRDGILPVFYADFDPRSYGATTPFVVIYVTRDGGTTWQYTRPLSVTAWGTLSFADMAHGWLANKSILYTTSDGGYEWTAMRPASFDGVRQVDFTSLQVGWAVRETFPFLLKTLDGGHTWTPVPYTILRE